MDEKDSNHELAIKLDENIEDDNKVVSGLVLLELASVYTRAGFDKPIELAFYSIDKVGSKLIEPDLNIAFKEALKYYTLKLRTLDLLHLVLSKIIGATKFVTFDKDIFSKRDKIHSILGIKVISVS